MMRPFIISIACLVLTGPWLQLRTKEEAVVLRGEAVALMQRPGLTAKDSKRILFLLDEAIAIDTLYVDAYWDKATYLCTVGKRGYALETLERLNAIAPNANGVLNFQGIILERMGKKKQALGKYAVEFERSDSVAKYGPDSLKLYAGIARAMAILLLKGKSSGIMEYNKLLTEYPQNTLVKSQRDIFYGFVRKKFIEDYCK